MGSAILGDIIVRSLELLIPELYFILFVKEQSKGRYTWRYVSKFLGKNSNLNSYVSTEKVAFVGFIIYLISNPLTKFIFGIFSGNGLYETIVAVQLPVQILVLVFASLFNFLFIFLALKP